MKFLVVKDRESQRWFVVGEMEWYTQQYYELGRSRAKLRRVQKTWIIPKPEHVSPFIEAHKVLEATTREEAKCQILNWK